MRNAHMSGLLCCRKRHKLLRRAESESANSAGSGTEGDGVSFGEEREGGTAVGSCGGVLLSGGIEGKDDTLAARGEGKNTRATAASDIDIGGGDEDVGDARAIRTTCCGACCRGGREWVCGQ